MKVKVSPVSRKVRREYAGLVAILSAFSSFYFILVKVPDGQRAKYAITASILLVALYVTIWVKANIKNAAKLNINNSTVNIKVGDLFKEDGLKAIAFNEYFDTVVDDILISKSSLNGKYILAKKPSAVKLLDKNIAEDSRLSEREFKSNSARTKGKKIKYKLGSVFVDEDYLLVAFSHFDKDNRAVLSLREYVSCLINFWDEVDQVYANRSVAVPLMGSGITRFKDAEVTPQELLKILIWTFRMSRVKFRHPACVTIVVHGDNADKINFYDLND